MPSYASGADCLPYVMAVVKRQPYFSETTINWAASVFVNPNRTPRDYILAVAHVNAWRTAHEGAVASMRPPLLAAAETIDPNVIVASRLKRLPTIIDKCSRLPKGVTLWDMQDVGGLRAVVDSVASVYKLGDSLKGLERFHLEWTNDWIKKPKRGYRSLHLIYSYVADDDDDPKLAGLKVEVQLRSRLQHLWGTANEMAGTFLRQRLKFGGGEDDWRRYFILAGAILAERDGTPLGNNVPNDSKTLRAEFEGLERKLQAFERLTAYSQTPMAVDKNALGPLHGNGYAVLNAHLRNRTLNITVFGPHQFDIATADYQAKEAEHTGNPDVDIVLIHLDELARMEEAYPNYWSDLGEFMHTVYPDWQERLDPNGRFG
jgi:hypothetical protein